MYPRFDHLDELLADYGLEWEQKTIFRTTRTLQESDFLEKYRHIQKRYLTDPLGVALSSNIFFVVEDKNRLFRALGIQEKAKMFPSELLTQVHFVYVPEKKTLELGWFFTADHTEEHEKYYRLKRKQHRLKSLSGLTDFPETVGMVLDNEMLEWRYFFKKEELNAFFNVEFIPELEKQLEESW